MKTISIWTICIVLLVLTVGTASAGSVDKIYVTDATGDTGSSVTVSISATNMNDLGSLQLDLQYDKSVITANNVTAGNATSGGMFTSNIDNNTGKITIGLISVAGIGGSGSITDITFKVIGSKGSSSPLNIKGLSTTDSKNNQINVTEVANAKFIVGTGTTTSPTTVVPTVTATSTHTPVATANRKNDTNKNTTNNITSTVTSTPKTTMVTPKETPVGTTKETVTATPKETQPEKTPGFGIILLIAAVLVIYIVNRNRNR